MQYLHRPDNRISVTIDSNVWNIFFQLSFDLKQELPAERFALFIPREVEIEIMAIPLSTKAELKNYIQNQIDAGGIKTTSTFGFATGRDPERRGSFGFGTFASEHERELDRLFNPMVIGKKEKNSGLTTNEADATLAKSAFSSVLLTCDTRAGPIKLAITEGGKVLNMTNFHCQSQSLANLITDLYNRDN